MKAAVLTQINAPLEIKDLIVPPLGIGQVLVRVRTSGICGKQLGEIAGPAGADPHMPHLLGHEGAGTVEEIGPGVRRARKGDRVVLHWRKGPGIDAEPPRYSTTSGAIIGGGPVTTFNERAVVSENRLTVIPDNVPFKIAALFGCAVTTGLGLVNNEAKLRMGESIVVAGCGGIGLAVIQGAAMSSAHPVIGFDMYPEKLEMARRFGATHLIASNGSRFENMSEQILKATSGAGPNVFVDCTGAPNIAALGFSITVPGGRIILVGQPPNGEEFVVPHAREFYHGKIVIDSQGGLTDPAADIPRYIGLYRAGKLKLDEMVTHEFLLTQINEALETVRKGKAGRCVITMD